MGRCVTINPSEFHDEICAWIAAGKTLRDYCRQDGKPSFSTVYGWMESDKDFETRFARARESGEDVIAQECLSIADDGSNDWQETEYGPRVNSEHVTRSRLRVDTRLKLLAKWNPKKYGDKVEQFISGPGGGPIQSAISVEFVKTGDSGTAQSKG